MLASVDSAGKPVGDFSQNPVISGNGRYVAFQSDNVDGTTNGTFDVFVHDLQTSPRTQPRPRRRRRPCPPQPRPAAAPLQPRAR